MPKLTQIEPPRVHFGAFLAWMLKLIQIKPPGVHFGALLAWMPKLAQIEPPAVHFGAVLAWMPKPVKSSLLLFGRHVAHVPWVSNLFSL